MNFHPKSSPTSSTKSSPKIRAILFPLKKWEKIIVSEDILSSLAFLVSLGEEKPTHLILVEEKFPSSLLALTLREEGKVFFSYPQSKLFFESPALANNQEIEPAGVLTFHFKSGLVWQLTLEEKRKLYEILQWQQPLISSTSSSPDLIPKISPCLKQSGDKQPLRGIIIQSSEIFLWENIFYSFPEENFSETSFCLDDSKLILKSRASSSQKSPFAGCPGEAFYQVLTPSGEIYVPLGKKIYPSFTEDFIFSFFSEKKFDILFWRGEKDVLLLSKENFLPLTRWNWFNIMDKR